MLICATARNCRRPIARPGPSHLQARWGVAEATAVYRPRHPERSSFYRIFEQRFHEYVAKRPPMDKPRLPGAGD